MRRVALLALLVVMVGAGPVSSQTVGAAPMRAYQPPPAASAAVLDALLTAKGPAILLQTDDVISVSVFGVSDLSAQQRIPPDGRITVPLVGPIEASGHTLVEVQQEIEAELVSKRLVHDPQVTVTAVSLPSRTVAATGEFTKPGVFTAFGSVRLADYIAQAQGFTNLASKGVLLRRASLPEPVSIPLGPDPLTSAYANIPIFPGDSIEAPRAGIVYAVGAFKAQGAFPMKSATPTTARQVIALAGGVGYEAALDDSQIMRVSQGAYILIPLKLGKILSGKQPDVALESDDVLFVPSSALKAALKGGGAGLIVSLATAFLLINN